MMEPLDSPERGSDTASPLASSPAAAMDAPTKPTSEDPEMVFFRRPDLSARRLFFQTAGTSGPHRRADSSIENAVPVQLVDMDGKTHIGMPASVAAARPFNEVTVSPQDARRDTRDRRLSRLVVTSDALRDPSTKRRLRVIQLLFFGAAVANIALTVSLLFPSTNDAWFYVDGYKSSVGPANLQRVKDMRPALLVLAIVCNAAGSVATTIQKESLLTVYILGTIVSDLWILTMLLPHAFFLLRLLLDVLLILLAVEARTYLTQPWFVTNFHRLRY